MKICLSTCPPEAADDLARRLLESRLAACVNVVGGLRSHFRWQGKHQCEEESLLVIKTADGAVEGLIAHLAAIHPYDTPEIVTLPVESAWPAYAAWVEAEVDRGSS